MIKSIKLTTAIKWKLFYPKMGGEGLGGGIGKTLMVQPMPLSCFTIRKMKFRFKLEHVLKGKKSDNKISTDKYKIKFSGKLKFSIKPT